MPGSSRFSERTKQARGWRGRPTCPGPRPGTDAAARHDQARSIAVCKSRRRRQDIRVLLAANRLQVTAVVDAAGLKKLEKMLAKYKEILKLQ